MRRNLTMQPDGLPARALLRLGPLLLSGLFLLWLSGGFPSANWRILAWTLVHFAAYQAAQGSSVLVPLVLLCVQALILALVWIWLVVLFLRELFALLNPPAQTPPALSRLANISVPEPLPVLKRSTAAGRAPGSLKNPLKDPPGSRRQSGTITLGKSASLKKEPRSTSQTAASQTGPAPAAAKNRPASPPPVVTSQSMGVPVSSKSSPAPGGPVDPFAVQPDLLELFMQAELPNISLSRQTAQAVHADQAPPPAVPEFVFGDPFEGPLPEVFEYDTDLKQSLADLKPASSTSGTSTSLPKKSGDAGNAGNAGNKEA